MKFSAAFAGIVSLAMATHVAAQAGAFTLTADLVQKGFASNGQEVPAAGQVASLTSTNNFIDFCKGKTFTNGKQVLGGSCNAAPMGDIPSNQNIPSSKFVFPANGDASIKENTPFTVRMAVKNWQLGAFTNAQANYYAAPQQLNAQGQIIGHTHFVIEKLQNLGQTTVTNPLTFAFFKGVNGAAVNGQVTADVTAGLPAGAYRLGSINAAANHQPVLAPIAQHGVMDDMVYFTIGAGGGGGNAGGNAGGNQGGNANAGNANAGNANAGNANAGAAGGANLQKFGGALAGVVAPVVSAAGGGKFNVVGQAQPFNDLRSALTRSCDTQNNACSDKANSANKGGASLAACNAQQKTCLGDANKARRRDSRARLSRQL